jgi:type IX secretion system PorP/SprF family membrane protein
MSTPSFSNIDRWLFEWKEGNLSPQQIEQLETFILLNPEIEVDKEMWDLSHVEQSPIVYPDVEKLKRKRRFAPVLLNWSIASVFLVALFITFLVSEPTKTKTTKRLVAANLSSISHKTQKSAIRKEVNKVRSVERNHKVINQENNQISLNDNSGSINSEFGIEVTSKRSYEEFLFEPHISNELTAFTIEDSNLIDSHELKTDLSNSETIRDSFASKNGIPGIENVSSEKLELNSVTAISASVTSKKHTEPIKRSQKIDLSFEKRWRKFSRTVQRMMDNPIALKNVKDPLFLVPAMQPMDVNFGSAGKLLTNRIQATSRAQWLGEENNQLISQLAIDGYSYGMRGGIGIQMNHAYYGTGELQHSTVGLVYSPKISIHRDVILEPSFRFKMGNKMLEVQELSPGQSIELERSTVHNLSAGNMPTGRTLWYRDLGAGLQINTKWFYIGGQVDNLFGHYDNMFSPNNSQERSPYHTVLSIGTEYESIRKTSSFSPYIVYQKKGGLEEVWVGSQFRYHWLTAGLAVSDNFEPAASLGIKFKQFMFVYSADYLKSTQLNKSSLSHQLTIRITTKPSRFAQRLLNQLQ